MKETPVFTICRKGFPGADRALVNLSATTGLTRHLTLADTNPDGPETKFLLWHLQETQPALVLFGGWDPVYKFIVDSFAHRPMKFGVYWTSSGGQTDISQEMPKLAEVVQQPAIAHQLFCSRGVAKGFQAARLDAHYLPLTLPTESLDLAERAADSPFTISLFCSPPEYKRKNIFNSLLALAGLSGNYRLLLNGLSQDYSYQVMLAKLKLPYHDLGWMSRDEYERQLLGLDLGLQLSFAESFNYVAADHILRGVPVLVSPMVPVVGFLSAELRNELTVPEPDHPSAIRRSIKRLLDDRPLARNLGLQAREELADVNQRHIEDASIILQSLL